MGHIEETMPRILFVIDDDSYFYSHRLELARAARQAGYEILVATHVEHHAARIEKEGFKLIPIRFRRGMQQPMHELAMFLELVRLYRRERPDIVHHVSVKLVAYGSVAARIAGVPAVVNAFTGLGYTFTAETRRARLIRSVLIRILKFGLAHPHSIAIFQNESDGEDLVRAGLMTRSHAVIIRGAGVNVSEFTLQPEPEGVPIVLLASRMLWDKGVGDFVNAVQLLKQQGVKLRGVLAGAVDPDSLTAICTEQLVSWEKEGLVEWWGYREDMNSVYGAAHVVALPTYYGEGLPKVLLEAAACGKPLVATRTRGCTDIVRDGQNGLLIPPKNPHALAAALVTLLRDGALRAQMGARGREIVVSEFTAQKTAMETLEVYRRLLVNTPPVQVCSPLS
jgi:glycosyltransferase involved in cell wall biosynthesis